MLNNVYTPHILKAVVWNLPPMSNASSAQDLLPSLVPTFDEDCQDKNKGAEQMKVTT
jgi:hypothetical protein